jgi:hypothetical protein
MKAKPTSPQKARALKRAAQQLRKLDGDLERLGATTASCLLCELRHKLMNAYPEIFPEPKPPKK